MNNINEQWTDLCDAGELPDEGGLYVETGGRRFGVFRLPGDEVRVIDDTCPHAGGSLSAGHVLGGCVLCPWHHWAFDIQTGKCPDNERIAVRVYRCRVRGRRVEAVIK